jgi:putative sporulation protein YtaF
MRAIHLISILSFAISANFDNVGVGVAYGIRGTCVPFLANFIIAVINSSGTAVSMMAGMSIARIFDARMSGVVGGLILMSIGIWAAFRSMRRLDLTVPVEDELRQRLGRLSEMAGPRKIWEIVSNPFVAHPDCKGAMGLIESFVIGLGLTMTNVVTGLAAGMIGLNVILLTLVTMVFSMAAIWVGRCAGNSRAFRWVGRYSGIVSGLLLLCVGILEVFF